MNVRMLLVVLVLFATPAQALDVTNYVKPGVEDYTDAINAALDEIRAEGSGVLYFPPGTYKTRGKHDVSGINGLVVRGEGVEVTKIDITHRTNDLFYWGARGDNATHHTYKDFTVVSSKNRRGGWVLRSRARWDDNFGSLAHSRIENIEVRNQKNGFWIGKYEFVWIEDVQMLDFTVGGTAVHLGMHTGSNRNMGSELFMNRVSIFGIDRDPWRMDAPGPDWGVVIEDTDAVYLTNTSIGATKKSGLLIRSNPGGHPPHNHFFTASFFDATRDRPSVLLKGEFMTNITFTGCWFASAGRVAGGQPDLPALLVDVENMGMLQITGGRALNASGPGIKLQAAHSMPVALTGVQVHQNEGGGIVIENEFNSVGPNISGVDGQSLVTSKGSNRMIIDGSRFFQGESFGTASAPFTLGDIE